MCIDRIVVSLTHQGVAVVEEVVRRQGAGEVRRPVAHESHALGRRHVLHDELEVRELGHEGAESALDEDGFAVEDVDVGVDHFPVHQQRQSALLHGLQRRVQFGNVSHPARGVGRGAGGVELQGEDRPRRLGLADRLRRRVVRQVQRHERREGRAHGQRREDALPVRQCEGHRRHGRVQVRHDDRPVELAARAGHREGQHGPVAQVHVEVVRRQDAQHFFSLLPAESRHRTDLPRRPRPYSPELSNNHFARAYSPLLSFRLQNSIKDTL